MTPDQVIWEWLKLNGKDKKYVEDLEKMYYCFVGHPQSQCHHFAFNNLEGSDTECFMHVLFPKTVPDPNKLDFSDFNQDDDNDNEEIIKRMTSFSNRVCPEGEWAYKGNKKHPEQTVCLLDFSSPPTAHSCRQEANNGLWWHKFTDLEYILGFTKPNVFGYNTMEQITVYTMKGDYDKKAKRWKKPA